MMLNMARSMFENNFDQANHGFLSKDFYTGSVVGNIENYGEAFLKFNIGMTAEFRSEVERVLAEKIEERPTVRHEIASVQENTSRLLSSPTISH